MLERMWRKRNTPPLLVGFQAGTTLEFNLTAPQILDTVLHENTAIPRLGIYPKMTQHITRTHAPLWS